MAKVTVVQVVYNSRRFIEPVFSAVFKQTFKDVNVVAVISGNADKGKEFLQANFPQVEIIDPGYNIGFAKGHNLVFEKYDSEFFQLVNPDLVMEADYIEKMLEVFKEGQVGAATGKLYQFKDLSLRIEDYRRNKTLDTTGVVIEKSGRARDRGQHLLDQGQYDSSLKLQAVSAAGAMYRRSALEAVKVLKTGGGFEYFDEDFHSYWEDVDLAWRMNNLGWESRFVPRAVGYHGRTAGSSKGGYKKVFSYIKFHRQLDPRIRQLNYRNHILMYLKNSKWYYPQFFFREFFMLGYILLFEVSTLKAIPGLLRLLPKVWKKRRYLKKGGTHV
ncbi:MAG: glycosyltransferase [Patescibacteria group bacterium]|nr:glycosyltransferase [Patescibacteria group bacterium]